MNFPWLSLFLKLPSLVPDKLVYKDVAMEDAFVSIQGILIDNIIFLKYSSFLVSFNNKDQTVTKYQLSSPNGGPFPMLSWISRKLKEENTQLFCSCLFRLRDGETDLYLFSIRMHEGHGGGRRVQALCPSLSYSTAPAISLPISPCSSQLGTLWCVFKRGKKGRKRDDWRRERLSKEEKGKGEEREITSVMSFFQTMDSHLWKEK